MNTKCYAPQTLDELYQSLQEITERSKIISGGTDLIIRLNSGLCTPDSLLYMGGIQSLNKIEIVNQTAEIGAMCTMTDIAQCNILCGPLGAITDAAKDVGSLQIRNNATIGGNVANASPAGDLAPVLFMLGAEALIAGPGGRIRKEPINKLITGPGKTSLVYNEAIIKFMIPLPDQLTRQSAFVKLGSRKTLTISRIGLAVNLEWDQSQQITFAQVVAGAISLTPVHVKAAEQALLGKRLDDDTKWLVGKALSELIYKITPEIFDRDYKVSAAFGVAEDVLNLFKFNE